MVTANETTAQPENAEKIEQLNALICKITRSKLDPQRRYHSYKELPYTLADIVQEYIDGGREDVLIEQMKYVEWWMDNGIKEEQD